jgi:hypothetical protein
VIVQLVVSREILALCDGVLCRPLGTPLLNLNLILPGTDVPGYRLFRPCGTGFVAVSKSLGISQQAPGKGIRGRVPLFPISREPAALRLVTDPAQRLNANTPAFRSTATREIPRAAGLIRPSTSS